MSSMINVCSRLWCFSSQKRRKSKENSLVRMQHFKESNDWFSGSDTPLNSPQTVNWIKECNISHYGGGLGFFFKYNSPGVSFVFHFYVTKNQHHQNSSCCQVRCPIYTIIKKTFVYFPILSLMRQVFKRKSDMLRKVFDSLKLQVISERAQNDFWVTIINSA